MSVAEVKDYRDSEWLWIPDEWDIDEFVFNSNEIEDISRIEAGPGNPLFDDHKTALEYCLYEIEQYGEVTEDVLFTTHLTLMRSQLPDILAGHYRPFGVRVGSFIAPRADRVPELVDGYLEETKHVCELDDVLANHFFFESIHPFADGNGRTGRILMQALLKRTGNPPCVVRSENREEYYKAINRWRWQNFNLLT